MRALIRSCLLSMALGALLAAPIAAQAHRYGGGYHQGHRGWGGGGVFWGGIGLGVGIGVGSYYAPGLWYPGYVYPSYVYPEYATGPRPVYDAPAPAPQALVKAAPDPVIYPNRGQSATQTETDRQACNQWAMTQPSAMAEASVFHRATLACMEGRGYTVK